MARIKIGIIDNGVDERLLYFPLQNKITVNEQGACAVDAQYPAHPCHDFKHGTICALIIQQNCPDSSISSVKILNDGGDGTLDSISPALEWCLQNEIYLVNLSLGTTCHADKDKLNRIINEYVGKGMMIVAATSNKEFISYPAAFSNVIGVAVGTRLNSGAYLTRQKGVDFEVLVSPEIESKTGPLAVAASNSYAAPYVTALAGKILLEHPKMGIFTLKQTLLRLSNHRPEGEPYYSPDWMVSAWIDKAEGAEERTGNFKISGGDYQQCHTKIDTIIFYDFTQAKYERYLKADKNLLYLGEKKIDFRPADRFYWDRYERARQIVNTKKRTGELQLPIIVCLMEEPANLLPLLLQLKDCFNHDGYQIYAASDLIESVLYNLEYIPVELLSDKLENLCDFLYWQTYYLQSDAFLIGLSGTGARHLALYQEYADMVVTLGYMENGFRIEIQCDGQTKKQENTEKIDADILYQDIIRLFSEEEDEH